MAYTSVNPEADSTLTVRTVSSDGSVPKLRVATPAAAYSAYVTQREVDRVRQLRYAAIAGIYAGFPPTPPQTMERMGMADMPNMNSKQFQAKMDAYCSNWNAINSAGSEWFEVEADHDDPMEAMRRSECLTTKFNRAIRKWDSTDFCNGNQYIIESAVRDKQMGLFDIGIAYFADGIDFRWRCIPTRRVLVPEDTKVTLNNCPALFIEDEMSVPDLYSMCNKPGWKKETIMALLYLRTNQTSKVTGFQETWGEWVERVRENDNWLYSDWPPLRFVHVYVKEFTSNINKGRISHGIFCPDITFPAAGGSDATKPAPSSYSNKDEYKEIQGKGNGWMFHKDDVAERWNQVLIAFSDNPGPEGTWHGCKGYGDLIFDGCHLGNLLLNQTYAGAMIRGSLMFQGGNEGDKQKLSQFKFTRYGLLNPGLQLEQVKFEVDVSAGFEAFNLNTSILNQNSRNFPQNESSAGGEQPTATQVNFDRADQAQFTSLQVSNYRATGLDCLGAEMYRRIAQPASKYPESWPGGHIAKEFREACKEYGIPESELLDVKFVRASRNVGTGNKGLDVMIADQLLTIATPGEGQKNAQMFKAVALVGPDMAPAFVQTQQRTPTVEDSIINQENLSIQSGQTPQAFGAQDHMLHLGPGAEWGHITLLQGLQQLAAQLMDQGIPEEENAVKEAVALHGKIEAGIQHSAQHVQFMSEYRRNGKSPALFEGQVNELNKLINDFTQFNETFAESIQSAQEAVQPQQGQMDPKMAETQADIERKNAMAQNDMEIKRQQAIARAENDQLKLRMKMEASAATHQQNLGQQAESNALEMQKQATLDQQEVEKQAITTGLDVLKAQENAKNNQSNNGSK